MSEERDCCPICATPFEGADMCAIDIEMGACHAACLGGSPVVDLDTGEPIDGDLLTFRFDDDASPAPTTGREAEVAERVNSILNSFHPDWSKDHEGEQALAWLANQILAHPPAGEGWRPTHRHCGGMECEVIGDALVQTLTRLSDYDTVTVYREKDGTLWARGKEEFDNGRFTELPAPPAEEGER